MKKKVNVLFAILLFGLLGLGLSCEKSTDEDPEPDLEEKSSIEGCQYPVLAWNDTMMVQTGSFKVIRGSEPVYQVFGFSFSVDFKGSIKELGVKVPETGTYTARIYNEDLLNNKVLAEADIVAKSGDWNYVSIDPLVVVPDETYMVCVYIPSKPGSPDEMDEESFFYHIPGFSYPQKVGDVTVEGYAVNGAVNEKVKPEPKDPGSFNLFNGLVDFCFEAD